MSIIQRVTQILTREKPKAEAPAPAQPVESEEKKQERLEAYRKFCDEQSKLESEDTKVRKKMKFRAREFNS